MASFSRVLGAGLAHGARAITRLLGRRMGARTASHSSALLAPIVEVQTHRGTLRFRCSSARSATLAAGFLKHEPDTRRWIDEHVKSGDVLWDAGANIGLYTLYAGLSPDVRVVAFEPLASTYAMLADNVALNGLGDRTVAVCAALSNASGFLPLYLASTEPGTAMHALGESRNVLGEFKPAGVQTVMSMRGDEIAKLPGLPAPTHLKIDVDGHELQVLEGLGDLLGRVRTVWIEVEGNATGIETLLSAHRFGAAISYGGRNRLFVNRAQTG